MSNCFSRRSQQICLLNCTGEFDFGYDQYINELSVNYYNELVEQYRVQCLGSMNENFDISYKLPVETYHYTLYKYDNNNNLIASIPPAGVDYVDVDKITETQGATGLNNVVPDHQLKTTYKYNSLYTLSTTSPDEGMIEYLYDNAGRIRISQNALQREQFNSGRLVFSYTTYADADGHVLEAGEYNMTAMLQQLAAEALLAVCSKTILTIMDSQALLTLLISNTQPNICMTTPWPTLPILFSAVPKTGCRL